MSADTEIKLEERGVSKQVLLKKTSTAARLERFLLGADAPPPMNVEFVNMRARVPKAPRSKETKLILRGVSGRIKAGEFLALMGPSGAGKSSLLNVIGNRFDGEWSGKVLINGEEINKKIKRNLGYVLQNDVLLPNLTVQQTLEVTAYLRLPEDMSKELKQQRIDDIVHVMGLTNCRNTMVNRVSGGEKKRVSIANELLMNPSIIFLDEPTSGLDSTSAFSILSTLQELCKQGRTIICAIHQPSSQMFTKFDKLLLLASGEIIYSGLAAQATNYLESVGYPCPIHFNPADFILELVTDAFESENEAWKDKDKIKKHLIESWKEKGESIIEEQEKEDERKIDNNSTGSLQALSSNGNKIGVRSVSIGIEQDNDKMIASNTNNANDNNQKWATGWLAQYIILAKRAFVHRRGHIVTKWKVIELVGIAVVSGMIYFRMERVEENAVDWIGATFFIQIYLSFQAMFRGIMYFPTEKKVVMKERQSGAYRLSAYFTSKMLAEVPADIFLPMVALTAYYWLCGFGDNFGVFILYMLATCLGIFTSNAFGTFLGCSFVDFEQALTALAVIGIGMMLLGGFYVKERAIPDWISWLGYLAHMKWSYMLSLLVIVREIKFKCADPSQYEVCEDHKWINGEELMKDFGSNYSPWFAALMLVLLACGWNFFGYLFLRKNTNIPRDNRKEYLPDDETDADADDDNTKVVGGPTDPTDAADADKQSEDTKEN